MSFVRSGIELILDQRRFDLRDLANKAKSADLAIDGIADSANRAERAIGGIDRNVTINASANDLDAVMSKLNDIRGLATIDVLLNVADMVGGIPDLPIVNSLLEMDGALARLEGRTGRMIPGAERLINDLYTQAWGESRDAIADVIVQADNLNISMEDLEEAVTTAFQVADTEIGDTNEVLRTMDSLVKNELAGSFQEAGDLLVVGLQNGANRGEDLLDTFNEYGSTFKQLRIDGPAALGLITSGLEAGVDNSDRIADALRETGIRLREIGTNEEIANAFARLDELSTIDLAATFDAYNAGEISGGEFFDGFFTSLAQANQQDPQAAAEISAALVGTISEDFGPEVISQLTPQWDEAMGTLEGRAETASNTINNTLSTGITEVIRTIETELMTTLDETFDLSGFLDNLKAQIKTFAAELRSGTGLVEALEISFGIEGVDEFISNFERIVGQLELVFLEIVRDFGNLLGKDTSGISAELARLSTNQLAFDLKITNADEVSGLIDTALNRGGDVIGALTTAADELFAEGKFTEAIQLTRAAAERFSGENLEVVFTAQADRMAAALYDDFNAALAEGRGGTAFEIANLIGDADMMRSAFELKEQLRASFDSAMATGDFSIAQSAAASLNDPIAMSMVEDWAAQLRASIDSALASGDTSTALQTAEMLGDPELIAQVQGMTGAVNDVVGAASGAGTALNEQMGVPGRDAFEDVSTAAFQTRDDIKTTSADIKSELEKSAQDFDLWKTKSILAVDLLAERITYVDEQLTGLNNKLNPGSGEATTTDTVPTGNATGGTALNTRLVGEEGPEIATFPTPAGIINAANTSVLQRALAQMGMGGQTINNYNNIMLTNNNNMANPAVADRYGYRMGRAVRGFAG